MGYCIVYGHEPKQKSGHKRNDLRFRTLIAASILLFSLIVRLTWEDGAEKMRQILLPGPLSAAEQAFSELIADVREGERVSDALTVFCKEILDEAD